MERNDAQTTPLAIIGMACLFPKADGLSGYWANVKRRVDAITEVPASHWAPEDYFDADPKKPDFTYARRGGFLEPVPFDPGAFGISPNTLEATDASQLLGLVVAQEALKNAGYADNAAALERTSVILGVTGTLQLAIPLGARLGHPFWRKALAEAGVEGPVADQIVERIAEAYVPWQENSFPGLLGNVVAGRIANRLNLGGTNCVVDAACASSLSATHMAAMELAAGRSDLVVTGGVDCFNDIFMYMCFSKTPALSPTGDSRPFDANGDGTILGEGIGMVVLKRLADAERDGDPIYAVIRSVGSSSDGRGKAIYAPSEEGQMKALRAAYKLAQVSPETIELIEAHGTGTKVGDAVELNALTEVYRAARPDGRWVALGSVKSQIGHTKAAAGVAGLIKAALALHHKVLPPTIKVREPQPAVATDDSPFYLNTELRPWLPRRAHPRRAAVSAFGFGGSNFHAVLEEHDAEKRNADWDGCVELVALSADSPQALETKLGAFTAAMTWTELQRAAATARGAFEASHPHRLAFVLEKSAQNLEAVLANVRAQLKEGRSQWTTPDGAAYGSGPVDGQLGVLFPGQGAQYVGMGRDLFARFPDLLSALAQADRAFADGGEQAHGDRLSDRLFPIPTFQAEAHEAQETALRATQCAQPAIGAMSLGAFRLLERFAVNPAAMAGHSYGELSALVAAGRLSEDDFFHLSCLRGRLMAEGQGDRGTMLAVQAPQAQVAELVERHGLSVVLANKNAPNQVVLSGETAAIAAAEQVIKDAGLRAVRLPVAAAFHSPLVADAARPFREALDDVLLFAGTVPVYANTTGALYPDDDAEARDLLGHQLAEPVEFVSQVQAMHAAGVRTFLEVGPGNRLSGLVKAILKDQPYQAIALDASGGKRDGVTDLARALAQLAALGHAVDLKGWENGGPKAPAKKPGMTIPLTGANYRSAKKPSTQPVLKVSTNGHAQAPASVTAALPTNGNGHAKVNGTAPHPASAPQATPTPKRVSPPPMPNPQPNAQAPAPALLDALKATQDSMAMLQKLQEQTAQLHKQFLDGQQTTQQAFKHLVDQQQQIFAQSLGLAGAPAPVVTAPSAPVVQVAPPTPVPVPTPVVAAAPVVSERLVQAAPSAPALAVECTLLAIVAEKTGYPVEMLNADMDMEADLGIDSIKRVEILSALQERLPGAPAIKPEHLGTLRTLSQIVGFLQAGMAPAAPAAVAPVEPVLLAIVAEKTGYPAEMLNLDMEMEADLGIDSIKRVEILSALQERLPGAPVIKPEHLGTLRTLRQIIQFLSEGMPAAPAAAAAPSRVEPVLLAIVAEKTGYPVEMLNPEMDMEADLGIDSIKRVEILSALQEQLPEAPTLKPEHLGSLRSLRQIIDHLSQGAPQVAPVVPVTPVRPAGQVEAVVVAVVSEKTGYPAEMLNPDMEMEADLGIDSIKRVEIVSTLQEQLPESPTVKPEHLGSLRTLRQLIDFLAETVASSSTPVPTPVAPVAAPSSPAPLLRQVPRVVDLASEPREALCLAAEAEIWVAHDGEALADSLIARLSALGHPARAVSLMDAVLWPKAENVAGLVILPSAAQGESALQSAFLLAQHAGPSLRRHGGRGGAFLVTVSRLDGLFGLEGLDPQAPAWQGGLAGLAKTAGHEWPEVSAKAIDVASGGDGTEALAAELFLVGPAEIGLSAEGRVTVALETQPVKPAATSPVLSPGDVVVVSGGARGVTAEVAVALAEAYQPTLVLLGRSGAPTAEPDWLKPLTQEAEIKAALMRQAPHAGLTPKALQEKYQQAMANREVLNNLDRMAKAGARVLYHSVDVRDGAAIAAALEAVRRDHGPISGVIHGAGVLADRFIADKTPEQFELVFGTKVGGLNALLGAVADDPLKVLVMFSSVTGRRGRTGQVDYAIANEVLNKVAQQQSRTRPACRVVAVNWGPWDGGMVTPALKRLFAEEGVGVVPLREGALYLVEELAQAGSDAVETLVLGQLAPIEAPAPSRPEVQLPAFKPRKLHLAFKRELDVKRHPFLGSHVINGKPVLPVAVIVEWLAHGALHANPGLVFHGVDEFRVFKGVILGDEPVSLQVLAASAVRQDGRHEVEVELRGCDARETLHAKATVVLANRLPAAPQAPAGRPVIAPYGRSVTAAYREVLFHGPHFEGIRSIEGMSEAGAVAQLAVAPAPSRWVDSPLREGWLADPLVLDASFQLMILWSVEQHGMPCLPCHAERYRQYRETFPAEGVTAVVRVREKKANQAIADFAFLDAQGQLVAELIGAESTLDASLAEAFRRNALTAAQS